MCRLPMMALMLWVCGAGGVTSLKAAEKPESAAPRIEFDFSKTPDLEDVAIKAKAAMERWYPRIEAFLATPNMKRPEVVRVVFDPDGEGVAAASGDRITVSAKYMRGHKDDLGMFIHEMTHVIQAYPPSRHGWLVEGIADYVRDIRFEPARRWQKVDPKRHNYNSGYLVTAQFLFWLERTHDHALVQKLNADLRAGLKDKDPIQKHLGRPVEELWQAYVKEMTE